MIMTRDIIYTSLTRISDLQSNPFETSMLDHSQWENGDYVALRITDEGGGAMLELSNGRIMAPLEGENVIGALGVRHATLEATGTWELARPEEPMTLLTGAGLTGKMTSLSSFCPKPITVEYRGHVTRNGTKVKMKDFVPNRV